MVRSSLFWPSEFYSKFYYIDVSVLHLSMFQCCLSHPHQALERLREEMWLWPFLKVADLFLLVRDVPSIRQDVKVSK